MGKPAIVTTALTKTYPPERRGLGALLTGKRAKPALTALDGVDLVVERGELFGLLGPNGAGKTTLVKILATLLLPTSGEARVAGLDVRTEEHEIRHKVGVVLGGDRGLYWRLTARENLWYFSQLYDMPGALARERIARVLADVGLEGRADDKVEDYSKGMKQRLHIARGLMTDPEILLLDEPTIGLDPHAARDLRALVRALVDEQKRTVVLTTHYLYEADALSDRVGVLHKGRIVALDTPAALKRRHATAGALVVRARGGHELRSRLAAFPGVASVTAADEQGTARYRLAGDLVDADLAKVAAEVAAAGARLVGVDLEEPTLEDVFVALTGDRIDA